MTSTWEPRLSEVAKQLVQPAGIVGSDFTKINKVARKVGIRFDKWQQGVLYLLLAKNAQGKYACGEGGLTLSSCRQIGKTYSIGNAVYLLCMMKPGLKVVWTAHHSRTSDETFTDLSSLSEHNPLLEAYVDRIRRANGQQEIRFKNGSRLMFGARERGFGRGLHSVDVEVFDEAQILTQSALDNMVAITNAAPDPLIVFLGNPPKPGDQSEAFADKRATALAGTEGMCYIELAAPDGSDLDDREAWKIANPSYPKRTSEAAILRMRNLLSDDSFRREALGIWDKVDTAHAIDPTRWKKAAVEEPDVQGRIGYGLDMPPDRSSLAVGGAIRHDDGTVHVELREFRDVAHHGTRWAVDWLAEQWPRTSAVVIDSQSPAMSLLPDLKAAHIRPIVTNAADMGRACGQLLDHLAAGTLTHLPEGDQPALDQAVAGAVTRPVGNAGAIGWNKVGTDIDISPLVACTLASYGLTISKRDPRRKQKVRR
ncbi:MAG: terminase [Bifidobacterium sp.]|nr:terminase [Bifidobacterium sp.]